MSKINLGIFFLGDQFLVAFLRRNKYNIEQTKYKIELFFYLRDLLPNIMKDRDPTKGKVAEILKLGYDFTLEWFSLI